MDDHGHYDEIISRTRTRSHIENVSSFLLSYFQFYFSYLFETNSQHELFSHKKAIRYKWKLIPNGSDITFGRLPNNYAQTPIHLPNVWLCISLFKPSTVPQWSSAYSTKHGKKASNTRYTFLWRFSLKIKTEKIEKFIYYKDHVYALDYLRWG
jgi:hypothetical protein